MLEKPFHDFVETNVTHEETVFPVSASMTPHHQSLCDISLLVRLSVYGVHRWPGIGARLIDRWLSGAGGWSSSETSLPGAAGRPGRCSSLDRDAQLCRIQRWSAGRDGQLYRSQRWSAGRDQTRETADRESFTFASDGCTTRQESHSALSAL